MRAGNGVQRHRLEQTASLKSFSENTVGVLWSTRPSMTLKLGGFRCFLRSRAGCSAVCLASSELRVVKLSGFLSRAKRLFINGGASFW